MQAMPKKQLDVFITHYSIQLLEEGYGSILWLVIGEY